MPVHCERRPVASGKDWAQVENSSGKVVARSATKRDCEISASMRNQAVKRKAKRASSGS